VVNRARVNPMVRFAPFLAFSWGALGAFLFWDAAQTGMFVEWTLGGVAVLLACANVALALRGRR
jgi:hypothetical protein